MRRKKYISAKYFFFWEHSGNINRIKTIYSPQKRENILNVYTLGITK